METEEPKQEDTIESDDVVITDEESPKLNGEKRPNIDEKGRFLPGNPGGPGRPKGVSIKDRVRKYLEEHPDEMDAFVKHFVEENRELAWQMLEGRPQQDVTSKGEAIIPIPILGPNVPNNNGGQENIQTIEANQSGTGRDIGIEDNRHTLTLGEPSSERHETDADERSIGINTPPEAGSDERLQEDTPGTPILERL